MHALHGMLGAAAPAAWVAGKLPYCLCTHCCGKGTVLTLSKAAADAHKAVNLCIMYSMNASVTLTLLPSTSMFLFLCLGQPAPLCPAPLLRKSVALSAVHLAAVRFVLCHAVFTHLSCMPLLCLVASHPVPRNIQLRPSTSALSCTCSAARGSAALEAHKQ
mgnify:FL=1